MKGLLAKEFITILKQYKTNIIISLIFIPYSIILDNPLMLLFIPFIFSVLPISALINDEVSHWNKYMYTMPVDKKEIVSSKYLSIVILAAISIILTLLGNFGLFISGKEPIFDDLGISMIGSLVLSFIPPAFLFPFYLKFGVTKGKIVSLIFVAATSAIIPTVGSIGGFDLKFTNLPSVALLKLGAFAVIIVFFALSWLLSIALYKKHEA